MEATRRTVSAMAEQEYNPSVPAPMHAQKHYNILPRETWDRLRKMTIAQAIDTIFTVAEFNRTHKHPYLIPSAYLGDISQKSYNDKHPAVSVPGFMPLDEVCKSSIQNKITPAPLSYCGYVLAGGAALRNVFGYTPTRSSAPDADYYPYSEAGYEKFMRDMNDGVGTAITKIERGEYNTTIYLKKGGGTHINKHQIIHRLYKQPWEVVCGFDQPCCKAFYDGCDIYMTLDCALCCVFQINPIDYRAESPTHIMRALKYDSRGFRAVVPVFPEGRWRFAAGAVHTDNKKWRLFNNDYTHMRVESKDVDNRIQNPEEFPPLRLIDSKYASDYAPLMQRRIHNANTYPAVPTVETPTKRGWSDVDVNLRAVGKGYPEYYVGVCKTVDELLRGEFQRMDVKSAIESQPYRRWWIGRERAVELEKEANVIMNRRTAGTHRRKKLAQFQLHRGFDAERLAAISAEMKMLFDDYVRQCTERETTYIERRKIVQFLRENPGAQNTASFHPIKRASHATYWGNNAGPYTYRAITWHGIMYMALLARRGLLPKLPKDVIGLIRAAAYMMYVGDIAANTVSFDATYDGDVAIQAQMQNIAISVAATVHWGACTAIGTTVKWL